MVSIGSILSSSTLFVTHYLGNMGSIPSVCCWKEPDKAAGGLGSRKEDPDSGSRKGDG